MLPDEETFAAAMAALQIEPGTWHATWRHVSCFLVSVQDVRKNLKVPFSRYYTPNSCGSRFLLGNPWEFPWNFQPQIIIEAPAAVAQA